MSEAFMTGWANNDGVADGIVANFDGRYIDIKFDFDRLPKGHYYLIDVRIKANFSGGAIYYFISVPLRCNLDGTFGGSSAMYYNTYLLGQGWQSQYGNDITNPYILNNVLSIWTGHELTLAGYEVLKCKMYEGGLIS